MKKLKVIGIVLAAALAMSPVMNAFASGLSPAGKQESPRIFPTPTPAAGQVMAGEMENSEASLCTGTGDYDGRIKKATYYIHGDEWTVVMKAGKGFADEGLPEGMGEWETVYHETVTPTAAPKIQTK